MLLSGWYDFMLDPLLRDYQRLVRAGHRPHLKIGPWFHVSPDLQTDSIRETLPWMDSHLKGVPMTGKPVALHIGGTKEWQSFDAYPPDGIEPRKFHLHGGRLADDAPPDSAPDRYRYDPNDPTPNFGGAVFAFTGAGPVDQAPLERRGDVLLYTSEPIEADLTIIGNATATLHVRTSLPNADVFVKLSDVEPSGRSTNVCDGIVRRTSRDALPSDGIVAVTVPLHATAYCFRRGHRLRLLIAGGAFPRYARNTGTDEPFGSATTLRPVDVEIFHDPAHPSVLHLPVWRP
jgi:putative CocE/NonD family hydrolase